METGDAQRPPGELVLHPGRPGSLLAVPTIHFLRTAAVPLEVVSHALQPALRSACNITSEVGLPGLASLFQGRLAISTISRRRIIEHPQ